MCLTWPVHICWNYGEAQVLQRPCTGCASPGGSAAKAGRGMGPAPTESLYCKYQSMAAAASSSRLCWVAASCSGQAASASQGMSAWTMTEGLGRSAKRCYLSASPPLSKGHNGGQGQDAEALQEPSHVPSSSYSPSGACLRNICSPQWSCKKQPTIACSAEALRAKHNHHFLLI